MSTSVHIFSNHDASNAKLISASVRPCYAVNK